MAAEVALLANWSYFGCVMGHGSRPVTLPLRSMSPRQVLTLLSVLTTLAVAGSSRALLAGTCGDYLQHSSPHKPTMADATGKQPDESPSLPMRCTGPRCSQAPAVPANLPAPATSTPTETRGSLILVDATEAPRAPQSHWRTSPTMNYLHFAAEDIFHPPRVA